MDAMIEEACSNLHCDRCSVFIVDEPRGEIWTRAARGTLQTIRIPLGTGIVGSVINSKKTANIEDAYNDPRFNPAIDRKTGYRTRSILATPVFDDDGSILAVIQAINKEGGPFTQDD
jgi:GAF domain-containing protein